MRIVIHTRNWMLIFIGCMLLISGLMSFLDPIGALEASFYQQIIDLTPGVDKPLRAVEQDFPYVLHLFLLGLMFGVIALGLFWQHINQLSPIFAIPFVSVWILLEVLLAILQQFWLPVIWPTLIHLVTVAILYLWVRLPQIKNFVLPEKVCQVKVIQQYIEQQDFKTALLILKNCPFSDDMFELAYDLGLELEQREDWAAARNLYAWLVQFDPGMQDFVERIDSMQSTADAQSNAQKNSKKEKVEFFGQYQLKGKKARGATATVYEAYDTNTHKKIALKVLNDKLSDDTGAQDIMTFLHEALTASQLDHPNIVRIHDADILDDQAYIAMEYIEGYPMSERLRRKRLITAGECLRILEAVLHALTVAHARNIVHGDIKPANIMYDTNSKRYILTDFGAAFSDFRERGEEKKIIGTPAYMSPEQLSGSRIDGRSDLFSLAVTVYHLLTGHQPFSGEGLVEMKKNVQSHVVDMGLLKVPEQLRQILGKALAKKPYQRYADASQMLQAVVKCMKNLVLNI